MLTHITLDFLTQLSANNSKIRMDAHRDQYMKAKSEVIQLAKILIETISIFDDDISLTHLEPKKTIFRINKDIRFSKDKRPYKENFGISISLGGRRSGHAGYYLHIQPGGKSILGGGIRRPSKEVTAAMREHILDDRSTFRDIIKNENFIRMYGELQGQSLKRPPKGYTEYRNDVCIKYLKMKDWYTSWPLLDNQLIGEQLVDLCKLGFETLAPFNQWMNEVVKEVLE